MADTNILQSINIGGKRFSVPTCWEELGLTKAYMLALLSRDEYTPTVDHKPTENDTIYTDPDSGNPAGFHAGQCVIYPDDEIDDGRGISIAKDVILNEQGIPTHIYWLHLSDIEKALISHSALLTVIPGNINKAQTTADAAAPRQIDISELDTMGTEGGVEALKDFLRVLTYTGPAHTRWAVTTGSGRNSYLVGALDVFSDFSRCVLTQVFETHHTFTDGVLNTGEHTDGAIRRYFRLFNINASSGIGVAAGEWTPWQECEPESMGELRTQLTDTKNTLQTNSAFIFRNQKDIAALTPKVEALESSGCFIAYWPDKDTQQYSFVSLEQWLEMKKTDEGLVPVGVLVIPDSGEPVIVSLTESTQRWATSPASTTIVYEGGYSESLGNHFTSDIAAHYRSDKLRHNGAGKCAAAEYCLNHPTDVGGTPMALAWYLPDLKIMMTIAKYRSAINKCLRAIDGATPFNEDKAVSYWTSNEASATKAFIVRMNPFRIFATVKTYQSGLVRPIRYLVDKVFQS